MRTRLSRLWNAAVRGPAPGIWVLAAACLASALGVQAAGLGAGAADTARLESIAGHVDRQTAAVLIQTSEPVPYVAADPDPSTVIVDLRNVTSAGVANRFAAGGGVVSGVGVETTTALDGAPITRVRIGLVRPAGHRVRSSRNVIRVEVDRQAAIGAAPQAAPVSGARTAAAKPATILRGLRAVPGPNGPTVELEGNGLLTPSGVELTKEVPYRLVLDFPGVSATVKATTPVGSDPIDRVRVARFSEKPLVTRVVLDLKQPAPYRLEQAQGRLVIAFGAGAQDGAAPSAAAQPVPDAASADPQPPPGDTTELLRRVREAQDKQAAATPPPAAAEVPAAVPVPSAPASPAPSQTAASPAKPPASSDTPAVSVTPPPPVAAARQSVPAPPPSTPADVAEPAAPPAAAPTGAQTLQAQGGDQKYKGAPISLDFTGADLRAVLRVFSEASGLNIIIDPKVQATVDVALRDVPWDQALEIILKSANCGWAIDGNVVRIAPLDVLANEEKQRRNLADEQALAGNLETLTRTLSYATAKDMRAIIASSALSKRGQIQVDERTNTLIIRDLPNALPAIASIVDTLDRAQPQVEIEARIVQVTRNFARQLGIKWGFSGRVDQAIGNTTGLAFPNNGSLGGRTGGTSASGVTPAVNLGTTGIATSAVGLSLGTVNGAFNLDVELSALESQGKGRILSTPRVLAQNNFQAEMMQGVQIPIQTIANNTVTVTFKDAALKLLVTPQVNANQTVILSIELENATPDYTKQINNIPPINTQRAKTQVMTKDSDTLVIGGVFVSREQSQNDHTPALSKIPLLGWLFRRDSIDDESTELLIFLTPRIIKG